MSTNWRFAGALVAVFCTPVWGWWSGGHAILTRAALMALPVEVPAFFRAGGAVAAHVVQDADAFKNQGVPELRNAERGEHYLDLELLEGSPLPPTRYAFIQLCAQKGLDPSKVGLAPYAAAEWTERLSLAFAEFRRWPDNAAIQSKCLVYAGFIAHYAQDLCQPLHTTIHFDGRRRGSGRLVGRGIHARVDALIEKIGFAPEELARGQHIVAPAELLPEIVAETWRSHALVDRVYTLEDELGAATSTAVRAFAEERARAAVRLTAALYVGAWERSARIELPEWLQP